MLCRQTAGYLNSQCYTFQCRFSLSAVSQQSSVSRNTKTWRACQIKHKLLDILHVPVCKKQRGKSTESISLSVCVYHSFVLYKNLLSDILDSFSSDCVWISTYWFEYCATKIWFYGAHGAPAWLQIFWGPRLQLLARSKRGGHWGQGGGGQETVHTSSDRILCSSKRHPGIECLKGLIKSFTKTHFFSFDTLMHCGEEEHTDDLWTCEKKAQQKLRMSEAPRPRGRSTLCLVTLKIKVCWAGADFESRELLWTVSYT